MPHLSKSLLNLLFGLCFIGLLSACQTHPYDETQQPTLSIGEGLSPTIRWHPQDAHVLRVYQADSKNADGLVWMLAAEASHSLQSPITYGVEPAGARSSFAARPLQAGAEYTVILQRKDSKSTDSGLSNTLNFYEAQQDFKARLPLPPKMD